MTIIKSYSDLEQSKKLAEILPLESADMMYHSIENEYGTGTFVATSKLLTNGLRNDDFYIDDIPCWSLAALLNVIPQIEEVDAQLCRDIHSRKWHVVYTNGIDLHIDTSLYINPIDACVAMIEKLNELNLL